MQIQPSPVLAFARMATVEESFNASGQHSPGFDTLRLGAAAAVVLHHAGSINHDIVRDDALYQFSAQYTHLGLLAVSVFFALSGFLVVPGLMRDGNVIDYLSRRFMRLMPLLVMVVMITALVCGPLLTTLALDVYLSDRTTWMYLRNITTFLSLELPGVTSFDGSPAINTPLWTLHFEWLCYGILAVSSVLGLLRSRWLFAALYCVVIATLAIRYGPMPAEVQADWGYLLLYLFAYFGSGVLIYLFRDKVPRSHLLTLVSLILLVCVLKVGLGHILAPFLIAYIVVGFGLLRFPWSDVLAKWDLSYGVYLMHAVIMAMLVHYFEFSSWISLFAVTLCLSLLAAWISWSLLEERALRHKLLPAKVFRSMTRLLLRKGLRL